MRASLATLGLVALLLGMLRVANAAEADARRADTQAQARRFEQLIDEGREQRRAGDYRKSIATLNEALSLARASRSPEREDAALGMLALSYRELPDLRKVLALRLENLALIRANPQLFNTADRNEESWVLQQVAGAYYLLKDLPRAIRYAREAVVLEEQHIARRKGDPPGWNSVGIGRMRQNLGQLLFLAGQTADSERMLRQALEDFEARIRCGQPALSPDAALVAYVRQEPGR